MKGLKQRLIRGGFARVVAQGINVVVRLASLMVFARLLDPVDFGLVGMVTAVTGVLSLFKDFGLSAATIQRESITDEQTSALFWINLAVGALLWTLSLAIAPIIVFFYGEPRLFWVTVSLAVGFIFSAVGVQHSALLQRQLRFTALAFIDVVSLLASTAIGMVMAFAGLGYWSLVGWSIALPAVNSLGAWLMTSWVPGRPSRQDGVGSMMRYGGTVSLNILVVYVAYNLDKVLLGRYWGANALGVYGRAYQLISMPTENLIGTIGGVAFPALSRLQNDRQLLNSYFLKGYKLLLTLALPIAVFCALFPQESVLVVLGDKWLAAAQTLRLLSPLIVVFALINPLGWLLYSVGLVGRSLKIALAIAPVVISGYLIGLPYGANGIAAGYSGAMMLWVIPHLIWCTRGTGISPKELLGTTSKPLLAATVATACALAVKMLIPDMQAPLVALLLGGTVLFGMYAVMLIWVLNERQFYYDLLLSLKCRDSAATVAN